MSPRRFPSLCLSDLGETAASRLFANTKKEESCWVWQASRNLYNYGQMRVDIGVRNAHRISYVLHHGPIPANTEVLHKCDNPPCVNPAHLFLGTHVDNIRDMDQKGRRRPVKGESHYHAKLSERQVLEMRERYAKGGITKTALGREYGVNDRSACMIINRKTWRHV